MSLNRFGGERSIGMVVQEKTREVSDVWVWPRPLTFEEFLENYGPKDMVELVDGTVVEKSIVQWDHERLQHWLASVLSIVARRRELGVVLGSRSAVKISEFRGRMPDLFFVSRDRTDIVSNKATYGAPDLVIEISSPGVRASGLNALEIDYTNIGVKEIVFIDLRHRRVRVLRRHQDGYSDETITEGVLRLETMGGLELELGWLLDEPRPDELDLLNRWLGA
jgi:Uma2 family endonuclease